MKKKRILTEEQKAKNKIYIAEWRANRSDEKVAEDKAKEKIRMAEYRLKNKAKLDIYKAEWNKANPGYIPPCRIENPDYDKEWQAQHNLGYWIVYIIHDYNGLGHNYAGQTQNIYKRMLDHKCRGKLNTDTYTIVKKCDTLEDALELESAVHNFGYHGDARTESGK